MNQQIGDSSLFNNLSLKISLQNRNDKKARRISIGKKSSEMNQLINLSNGGCEVYTLKSQKSSLMAAVESNGSERRTLTFRSSLSCISTES
jgi:hypothetical protein